MPSVNSSPSLRVPVALLLSSGTAFATVYALSRPVSAAGVSPLLLIMLQALCGGMIILAVTLWRGQRPKFAPAFLRYYIIGGAAGFAVPNTLLYIVIPHIGVGIATALTSLSPLLTWGIARLLGMEPHSSRRVLGLGVGVAGAALLATRGNLAVVDAWVLLGLLVPTTLAFGNIYRTAAWPKGEPALPLAAGMLLVGGIAAVPVAWMFGGMATTGLDAAGGLIAMMILLYAGGYVLLFEMQRLAGPVFLSQLGYVIPPVGLAWGLGFFGETLVPAHWAGLGLILAGLLLVNTRR